MSHALRKRLKSIVLLFGVIIPIFLGSYAGSARAQSSADLKLRPDRVFWTDLLFEAKDLFVTAVIKVRLASLPRAEAEASLMASPKGTPVEALTSAVYLIAVNTIIDPLFRSPVTLKTHVWFDPESASALQRMRQRQGEDDFQKMYRFTSEGVYRFRKEPSNDKEVLLPPEKWTDVKESFYPYDLSKIGCPSVSESSIIPYILSAARLSQESEPINLCVFHKRLIHQVALLPSGTEQLDVDYTRKSGQTKERREGPVDALRVTVLGRPLSKLEGEEEAYTFLGLKGYINIYIEKNSGIPVKISGEIPALGRADFQLKQVRLSQKAGD